jgi:hypothetical protein
MKYTIILLILGLLAIVLSIPSLPFGAKEELLMSSRDHQVYVTYGGRKTCLDQLSGELTNPITSIRVEGGAKVQYSDELSPSRESLDGVVETGLCNYSISITK